MSDQGPETPIRELGGLPAPSHASPVSPTSEIDPNLGILDDETVAGADDPSALEAIEAELAEELEADVIYCPVPRRKGYELRFKAELAGELLQRWARSSQDRKAPGGIDELKLALLVVCNLNTGIMRNGSLATVQGEPMTVRTKAFLDIMREGRPFDAVKKLYGSDGHVMATAREVLSEAGYGEDLVAAAQDPTVRSSSD